MHYFDSFIIDLMLTYLFVPFPAATEVGLVLKVLLSVVSLCLPSLLLRLANSSCSINVPTEVGVKTSHLAMTKSTPLMEWKLTETMGVGS